jgi:hypothetical protein
LLPYALRSAPATSSGAAEVTEPEGEFDLQTSNQRVRIAAGGLLPYGVAILGGALIYVTRELV